MIPCTKCNSWQFDIEDVVDLLEEDGRSFVIRDGKMYAICPHGSLADGERFVIRWIDARRWIQRWPLNTEIQTVTLSRLVLTEVRRRLEQGKPVGTA